MLNLEAQIFASLIQVMQNTKRANKGIRISHLHPIIICGLCKDEGIRPKQLAESLNVTIQAARSKLKVGAKHGYFYKGHYSYYLSNQGQAIYNSFMKTFRQQLESLTMILIRRAVRRTEGYWQRKAQDLEFELAQAHKAVKQPNNAA